MFSWLKKRSSSRDVPKPERKRATSKGDARSTRTRAPTTDRRHPKPETEISNDEKDEWDGKRTSTKRTENPISEDNRFFKTFELQLKNKRGYKEHDNKEKLRNYYTHYKSEVYQHAIKHNLIKHCISDWDTDEQFERLLESVIRIARILWNLEDARVKYGLNGDRNQTVPFWTIIQDGGSLNGEGNAAPWLHWALNEIEGQSPKEVQKWYDNTLRMDDSYWIKRKDNDPNWLEAVKYYLSEEAVELPAIAPISKYWVDRRRKSLEEVEVIDMSGPLSKVDEVPEPSLEVNEAPWSMQSSRRLAGTETAETCVGALVFMFLLFIIYRILKRSRSSENTSEKAEDDEQETRVARMHELL